ncbi:MAG: hypothetical protein FJ303_25190, partial [Planctomycetes bacterium]|nr:hypothetical protein [Planctomycetota bacterium]
MISRIVFAALFGCLVTGDANANGRIFPRLFPHRRSTIDLSCPPAQPVTSLPSRNMVNLVDRNLPTNWCIEDGKHKHVKWSVQVGYRNPGSPVIADGRVLVSTNHHTENFRFQAAVSELREADGKLLWRNVHDHPPDFRWGWAMMGAPSMPTVDGRSVYYITPSAEVICADAQTGKIDWRYDCAKELRSCGQYMGSGGKLRTLFLRTTEGPPCFRATRFRMNTGNESRT